LADFFVIGETQLINYILFHHLRGYHNGWRSASRLPRWRRCQDGGYAGRHGCSRRDHGKQRKRCRLKKPPGRRHHAARGLSQPNKIRSLRP
jgi:hypothetical protein